jgi:hypothetical protein
MNFLLITIGIIAKWSKESRSSSNIEKYVDSALWLLFFAIFQDIFLFG